MAAEKPELRVKPETAATPEDCCCLTIVQLRIGSSHCNTHLFCQMGCWKVTGLMVKDSPGSLQHSSATWANPLESSVCCSCLHLVSTLVLPALWRPEVGAILPANLQHHTSPPHDSTHATFCDIIVGSACVSIELLRCKATRNIATEVMRQDRAPGGPEKRRRQAKGTTIRSTRTKRQDSGQHPWKN